MDLTIQQGTDFVLGIYINGASGAFSLTGCSLAGQIRADHGEPLLASFVCTTSGTSAGYATISLSNTVTTSLPSTGPLAYDLLLIRSDATKLRLLEGAIVIDPSITYSATP